MKSKFLIVFISLFYFSSNSQELPLVNSFQIQAEQYWGQDNLGAFYFSKQNTLTKKDNTKNFTFSKLTNGKIKFIDISNPLRILIFYDETQQAVIVDNQLNEIKSISFTDITPRITVTKATNTSMNKLWIHEACTSRIYLYDIYNDRIEKLTPIISPEINYFQTDINDAYWVNAASDWYSCTVLGEIELIGQIPKFKSIQFINNKIALVYINDALYKYHVYSRKFDLIQDNLKSDTKYYYANEILSIFTDNQMLIYKIKIE